jgi:Tfp pilus assembly protein PilO
MILVRRPVTLYDVDALGLAAALAMLLSGWLLVLSPWQRMWDEYQALVRAHHRVERELGQDAVELQRAQERLTRLEQIAAAPSTTLPDGSAAPRLLEEIATLARASGLELRSMVPRPPELHGPHLVQDIDLEGRGASIDFLAFLRRLAQANPCQSLEDCTIKRMAIETNPECALRWTLRLFLRPPDSPVGHSSSGGGQISSGGGQSSALPRPTSAGRAS